MWSLNNHGMTTPKIRLQLAERLKRERQKAGLTQERLAELLGVSTRYYQMLESQKPTAIKIDLIEKLAKSFGLPAWKILKP